jgi:hypothetical protein
MTSALTEVNLERRDPHAPRLRVVPVGANRLVERLASDDPETFGCSSV